MPKPQKNRYLLSVAITESINESLRERAEKAGITVSQYVRQLIDADLNEHVEFYAHHAAVHSYFTFMGVMRLLDLIDPNGKALDELVVGMKRQVSVMYGPMPALPKALNDPAKFAEEGNWLEVIRDGLRAGMKDISA